MTQTALVLGEPGIGKTTLLAMFGTTVRADGATVLRVSGDEDEVDIPYGVIDQIVTTVGAAPEEWTSPAAAGTRLAALLIQEETPVVVVVDDADAADTPSLLALSFAMRRLHDAPVLAILACGGGRPANLPGGLVRLAAGDTGFSMQLGGLDLDSFGVLLEPVLGRLPAAQLARLHEHTGGNPMHALTLARDVDGSSLRGDVGAPLPAPDSMTTSVLAQVASLPATTQAVIAAGAVLGMSFTVGDALTISGVSQGDAAMTAAVDANILEPAGRSTMRFGHSMTRSAIYYDLGPARTAALHWLASEVTEGRERLRHRLRGTPTADEALAAEAAVVADALARSGAWGEAAAWLDAAADVSPTQQSRQERSATAVLYRGYGAGPSSLDLGEPVDLDEDCPVRLLVAGFAAAAYSRYGDAETILRRAWDRVDPGRDFETASRIALRLSDSLQGQLRADEALEWAQRAVDVLPPRYDLLGEDPLTDLAFGLLSVGRADDAVALVADHVVPSAGLGVAGPGVLARGVARLYTDDLVGAMEDLSDAADRYLRTGPPHKYIEAQGALALVNYRIGLWDFSARHADEAVEAAAEIDIPQLRAMALAVASYASAARGQWKAAEDALSRASAALALRGSYQALGLTWLGQAQLEVARGNDQGVLDALSTLGAAASLFTEADDQVLAPWRVMYGTALVHLDRVDEAAEHAERLSAFAELRQAPSALAAAGRLRGLIAAARGDLDGGRRALKGAIDLFARIPMPFEAAQAEFDLGAMLRRAGLRREAAARLDAARTVFAALDAEPFTQRCDAELASCGLRRQSRFSNGASTRLTAAETAVAELVAQGRSNKQVALDLTLSVRTVEDHLRRIYAKLGITSRSQLAATFRDNSDTSA